MTSTSAPIGPAAPVPDGSWRPRLAVGLTVVVVAIAIVALLATREAGTHRYVLALQDAGQLVDGDEVRVGGRRVGTIGDLRLAPDRTALLDLEVDDDVAPLHEGTTATVRAPSLAGIADRHVSLSPGPNTAPVIDDGGRIAADRVPRTVDVDQLLSTLDGTTRVGLRELLRGASRSTADRERLANATLEQLNPALGSGRALFARVARDAPALEAFLDAGSQVVGSLAQERTTLPSLVADARSTARAVVAEEAAVNATLDRLPATLRRGSSTLAGLDRTLDGADPLVEAALPATARLAPLLRRLRPLAAAAVPTVADARELVRSAGPSNDLIDLLRRTPGLADATVPALQHTAQAATSGRPIARFARPFAPDLVGWLRDFSQVSAGYDANGHYARIQPLIDEDAVAGDPLLGPLVRSLGGARGPAGGRGAGDVGARRCPGTATQLRPDGSNDPRRSPERLDCDFDAVLPGP
ncbi:MlaD family protein [Patulibacter sp.]|uniref:MlaD family protein n=1 Tax=Patulibacter sp. TaxID=1912859 RepID=UPI002723B8A6|nr:MlaD family protein [Patulibacter sp.]MDO9408713.1 MlaD family protein [Patulibacter sp.]